MSRRRRTRGCGRACCSRHADSASLLSRRLEDSSCLGCTAPASTGGLRAAQAAGPVGGVGRSDRARYRGRPGSPHSGATRRGDSRKTGRPGSPHSGAARRRDRRKRARPATVLIDEHLEPARGTKCTARSEFRRARCESRRRSRSRADRWDRAADPGLGAPAPRFTESAPPRRAFASVLTTARFRATRHSAAPSRRCRFLRTRKPAPSPIATCRSGNRRRTPSGSSAEPGRLATNGMPAGAGPCGRCRRTVGTTRPQRGAERPRVGAQRPAACRSWRARSSRTTYGPVASIMPSQSTCRRRAPACSHGLLNVRTATAAYRRCRSGAHVRLAPDVDVNSLRLPRLTRMIAEAAQRYGLVVRGQDRAIALVGENPARVRENPYRKYFLGRTSQQLLANFPWDRLQVLQMHLCTAAPCAPPSQ